MDPVLMGVANVLQLVFFGWLLVMVLRHMSKSEKHMARSEEQVRGLEADALLRTVATLEADRDRMRERIESLEAIVTSEGYDLEREARSAGLRLDLDVPVPPVRSPRQRVQT